LIVTACAPDMNRPKKHHYVPQFLLRRFALLGTEHLFVFDKATDKVFRSNIEDIAAENLLYEFTLKGKTSSIEAGLARFESMVASVLAKLAQTDNITQIDDEERLFISAFVAQLMLRSPNSIATQRDFVSKMRRWVRDKGWDPDAMEQIRELDRNEEKASIALMLPQTTLELAPALFDKDWTLQAAPAGETFLISDNPVGLHNQIDRSPRGNLGLRCEGIEVFLPLGPDRCLAIRCTSWIERMINAGVAYNMALIKGRRLPPGPPQEAYDYIRDVRSGSPRQLRQENVTFTNSLQVFGAERFVYSATDDFDLVRDMLQGNPNLRMGPRFEVG
jgi:hypothetical protein